MTTGQRSQPQPRCSNPARQKWPMRKPLSWREPASRFRARRTPEPRQRSKSRDSSIRVPKVFRLWPGHLQICVAALTGWPRLRRSGSCDLTKKDPGTMWLRGRPASVSTGRRTERAKSRRKSQAGHTSRSHRECPDLGRKRGRLCRTRCVPMPSAKYPLPHSDT